MRKNVWSNLLKRKKLYEITELRHLILGFEPQKIIYFKHFFISL